MVPPGLGVAAVGTMCAPWCELMVAQLVVVTYSALPPHPGVGVHRARLLTETATFSRRSSHASSLSTPVISPTRRTVKWVISSGKHMGMKRPWARSLPYFKIRTGC